MENGHADSTDALAMLQDYDRGMLGRVARDYYGGADFYNYGYWTEATTTQQAASENLLSILIEAFPNQTDRILDVACGLGASTRLLESRFPNSHVCAVNLSEAQLRHARRKLTRSDVVAMDAAHLALVDSSFDAVLCVESAFHFKTRVQFFEEANRVLAPGGRLVLSDILYRPMPGAFSKRAYLPRENRLAGIGAYRRQLEEKGFVDIQITDATAHCSRSFSRNLRAWPFRRLLQEPWNIPGFVGNLSIAVVQSSFALLVKHYLIVSATKAA